MDTLVTVVFDGPTEGAFELHVPDHMMGMWEQSVQVDARAHKSRARMWFGNELDLDKPDRMWDFRVQPEATP